MLRLNELLSESSVTAAAENEPPLNAVPTADGGAQLLRLAPSSGGPYVAPLPIPARTRP